MEFSRKLMGRAGDEKSSGGLALSGLNPQPGEIIFTDRHVTMPKKEVIAETAVAKAALDLVKRVNGKNHTVAPAFRLGTGEVFASSQGEDGVRKNIASPPVQPAVEKVAVSKMDVSVKEDAGLQQATPSDTGENIGRVKEVSEDLGSQGATMRVHTETGSIRGSKKITMEHPFQAVEKSHLRRSAKHLREGDLSDQVREGYLKQLTKVQARKRTATKEDVTKARSLRKGILGSIEQKKIDTADQAQREEEEHRVEQEKLARLEAFKNENPDYYQKYEGEIAKLEPAFAQEFEASREAYKTWELSLKRSDGKLLKSQEESPEKAEAQARMAAMDVRFHKMADLVEEFNNLDTRLPEDGLKGLLLLTEMRALEKEMPKNAQEKKKKVLDKQKEMYGSEEPNVELIEKGHIQVLIKRELEVLKRNCEKVRERELFMTNNFPNIGQLEDHIQSLADLADSFDDETPMAEVEKALEELRTLENMAFSETPPERGKPFGKKAGIKRLRDDKEVAGGAKGERKFVRNRGDKRDLALDETGEGASQEPIPDKQKSDMLPQGNTGDTADAASDIETFPMDELPSFETVVSESERQGIVGELQGFIDGGLVDIVDYLKETGNKELGALLNSKSPEDIKVMDEVVQPLLDTISTSMLNVAIACGERIKSATPDIVVSAIHKKGTDLLIEAQMRYL